MIEQDIVQAMKSFLSLCCEWIEAFLQVSSGANFSLVGVRNI